MWKHELASVLCEKVPVVIAQIILEFTLQERVVLYEIGRLHGVKSVGYIYVDGWVNKISVPGGDVIHCHDTDIYYTTPDHTYSTNIATSKVVTLPTPDNVLGCVNVGSDLYSISEFAITNLHCNTVIPTPSRLYNVSAVSIGNTVYISSTQYHMIISVYVYNEVWTELLPLDPVYRDLRKCFLINVDGDLYVLNFHRELLVIWKLDQEWSVVSTRIDRHMDIINAFGFEGVVYVQTVQMSFLMFDVVRKQWSLLDLPPDISYINQQVLSVICCNV